MAVDARHEVVRQRYGDFPRNECEPAVEIRMFGIVSVLSHNVVPDVLHVVCRKIVEIESENLSALYLTFVLLIPLQLFQSPPHAA